MKNSLVVALAVGAVLACGDAAAPVAQLQGQGRVQGMTRADGTAVFL